MHYVTSDERTNTVYVNGPPDKIAQAKSVIDGEGDKAGASLQAGKPRIDLKLGGANIFIAPVTAGDGAYRPRPRRCRCRSRQAAAPWNHLARLFGPAPRPV